MIEKHPLKYAGLEWKQIFPFLQWCTCLEGSEKIIPEEKTKFVEKTFVKSDDTLSYRSNERIVAAKNKSKMGFLSLGYGFVAYFSFMEFMIILFSIMTLLSLPSLYYFITFRKTPNTQAGLLDKFSLANLGYSSTLCDANHLEIKKLHMSCETGEMQELVSFGIIPPMSEIQDACYETEDTLNCNRVIQLDKITSHIFENCIGNRSCSINFGDYLLKDIDPNSTCLNVNARFYTQMLCKVTDSELEERKNIQLMLVWTIILSALIYFIAIEWYGKYSEKFEDYDKSTTTTSDFTVEFKFDSSMYKQFEDIIYPMVVERRKKNKAASLPCIVVFREYISNYLEIVLEKYNHESFNTSRDSELFENNQGTSRINKSDLQTQSNALESPEAKVKTTWQSLFMDYAFRLSQMEENKSAEEFGQIPGEKFHIADINFTFKNRRLMDLLLERGVALECKDHETQVAIEKDIDKVVSEKYEELTTPTSMFVTFETECGYLAAIKMKEFNLDGSEIPAPELNLQRCCTAYDGTRYFKDYDLSCSPAKEPSFILWECYGVRGNEKCCKFTLVITAIMSIVLAAFVFFFYTQKIIYDYMNVYPYVDCEAVEQTYDHNLIHYGVQEYHYLTNFYNTNNLTSSMGILNCLCQNYSDTHGMISTFGAEMYLLQKGQIMGGKVCYHWSQGKSLIFVLDLVIAAVIAITDFVLRVIIIFLVEWVDFKSLTHRLVIVQSLLFFSQYLNSGLSLMLISFNIDEMVQRHVPYLDGDYPDFTQRWFFEVSSSFITPMAANVAIPVLEFVATYLLYYLFCWHDRFFTCDRTKTRSKTLTQYIRCHMGPENEIFDRYAFMLMMIYINITFGVGLPLLFPMTLIALICHYVFEKLFQVHWYSKSVMMGDFLNKDALVVMKWAIHLYTFFGYWFITNRQIFYNDVTPTMRRSDREITNHTFYNIPMDQTLPLLIFMFSLFSIMIIKSFYSIFKYYCMPYSFLKRFLSKEGLFTYYDSLSLTDAKTLFEEEKYRREDLGYSKLKNRAFLSLKKSISSRKAYERNLTAERRKELIRKTIINVPSYDQLSNLKYQEDYHYIPVHLRRKNLETKRLIPDLDYTRKMVDLAYWYELENIQT
ncbi:unnamed protein product [Moneuplotes crassus]|uniref:CSC1/OSCA1-like cytosolic domain-containing protein n=1 Tax=Euplotes crassus TaxID=5936 RepID=A0AAD1XJS7_EUPCR|nr:unnamed protein product [Moneuplotes crassus]